MNILVACLSYDAAKGGGGVRLAYDLTTGLVKRGHTVTVVCEDLHGRGIKKEILDGVTVLRYNLPPSHVFAIRRHAQHFQAVKKLLDENMQDTPDVLHGHSLFQYLAILRFYKGKVRSCFTIHSPFVDELRIAWGAQGVKGWLKILLGGLFIIRKLEHEAVISSDILTAESEFTRELIRQQYGTVVSAGVRVVPGWIDLCKFVPLSPLQKVKVRREMGAAVGRPVLFVLRRLEARMGLDNLLRSIALVKKRGFHPYVAIGGSGSCRACLEKMRDKLGLQDDVRFLGFVPADKLPQFYAACDVSVIPTTQLECFGIIALEALACGIPTLVTPVGALPEVMRNFEPRWVALDYTPEAIADLICAYLSGALPKHTAEELRRIIAQRYVVEDAIAEYDRILSGS